MSETDKTVIVEFLGAPGAGKSTLSHASAQALRDSGWTVNELAFEIGRNPSRLLRILHKGRLAAGFVMRHPLMGGQAVIQVVKTGQNSLTDTVLVTFNLFYLFGLMTKLSYRSGLHLLDQGLLQAFWSVNFTGRRGLPAAYCRELLRRLYGAGSIGGVVIVQAPISIIAQRLAVRRNQTSRLQKRGLSGEHLRVASDTLQEIIEMLEEGSRERSIVAPFTVDNDGSASCDHCAIEIAQFISSLETSNTQLI